MPVERYFHCAYIKTMMALRRCAISQLARPYPNHTWNRFCSALKAPDSSNQSAASVAVIFLPDPPTKSISLKLFQRWTAQSRWEISVNRTLTVLATTTGNVYFWRCGILPVNTCVSILQSTHSKISLQSQMVKHLGRLLKNNS